MMLLATLTLILVLIFIFYKYYTRHYDYWSKSGVPHLKPKFPFGNIKDVFLMKKTMGDGYGEMYWIFKNEPFFGFYKLWKPTLMVRDPELVKDVLVSKFNCFEGNDYYVSPKIEPSLAVNPFNNTGESWKHGRLLVTSSTTGLKIKSMMPNIITISKEMVTFLIDNEGEYLEGLDVGGRYTTDIVSCCAYSLRSNSFKDPDSEFRRMSANMFDGSFKGNFATIFAFYAPSLNNIFKWKILSEEATAYFEGLIREAVEYRTKNNIVIEDMVQTLINENIESIKKNNKPAYSYAEMAAHCMTFSIDGFETGALLISYILYELSMNTDAQEKLRGELVKKIKELDSVDYDSLHEIPYLEWVIYETLRKHSPGTTMTRLCSKEVTLECRGKSVKVEPKTPVVIPLLAIMNDPSNFPEPEKFIPERFDVSSAQHHPYTHFPFGVGPRSCPGKNFAMTMVKMGVATIILNFKVMPKDKTLTKIEEDPMYSFFHHSKCPIYVKFEKIVNRS